MTYLLITIALVAPWVGFYLGENVYASTYMWSHHSCESTLYGCLKIDFASFFVKGVFAGLLAGWIPIRKYIVAAFIASVSILVVCLHWRLGLLQDWQILGYLSYHMGTTIPLLLGCFLNS